MTAGGICETMEYSGEKLDDILGFGSWKNSSGWGVKSVANSVACQEGIRERFFFFLQSIFVE